MIKLKQLGQFFKEYISHKIKVLDNFANDGLNLT